MIPIINLRSSSRINNTKTTNFVSSSTYYIKTLRYTGTQNKHHHITFKNILSQKNIFHYILITVPHLKTQVILEQVNFSMSLDSGSTLDHEKIKTVRIVLLIFLSLRTHRKT